MKRLYTASGLFEAYLLRDFLVGQGIDTLVFNEHSVGAVGELPCNEALPELWVRNESHFERARSLIETRHDSDDIGSRPCPACAEENPANFEICWRCGGALVS